MHEVTLLLNIAIALVVAFMGGVLARRIGLPTIIGYMLGGIVIGPFTPGFVGDAHLASLVARLCMSELLLTQTWVLVQGAAIGFLVAAAIGPIAMLCIRTTLERGRIAGIAAGMGVAVADTIYAAIGAYGISFVGAALTLRKW